MPEVGASSSPAAGFSPSTNSGPAIDFNPNVAPGPAPAITSFQSASAQTMAQKQALLDSIAQNGTAGKALYAQQQQALSAVRNNAIANQLQGSFAQYGGGGDLAAANDRSAQAVSMAQAALGDFTNAEQRGNANYYDQINAQIPIAQQHTQMQVNAIKGRQDQNRMAFEAEQRRLEEQAAMQREEHAAAMERARIANTPDPLEQRLKELAIKKGEIDIANSTQKQGRTAAQQALMDDANNHLGGATSHGFQALTNILGAAKNESDALAGLVAGLNSDNAMFKTPSGHSLDYNTLASYIHRYYAA